MKATYRGDVIIQSSNGDIAQIAGDAIALVKWDPLDVVNISK